MRSFHPTPNASFISWLSGTLGNVMFGSSSRTERSTPSLVAHRLGESVASAYLDQSVQIENIVRLASIR
jgi:hypothetical protein